MRIDTNLIHVAAENSMAEQKIVRDDQKLKTWIGKLSNSEKDKIIVRLITDNDPHLGNELLQRFKKTLSEKDIVNQGKASRSVKELLKKAEAYFKER
jgi:hypothetical protein